MLVFVKNKYNTYNKGCGIIFTSLNNEYEDDEVAVTVQEIDYRLNNYNRYFTHFKLSYSNSFLGLIIGLIWSNDLGPYFNSGPYRFFSFYI